MTGGVEGIGGAEGGSGFGVKLGWGGTLVTLGACVGGGLGLAIRAGRAEAFSRRAGFFLRRAEAFLRRAGFFLRRAEAFLRRAGFFLRRAEAFLRRAGFFLRFGAARFLERLRLAAMHTSLEERTEHAWINELRSTRKAMLAKLFRSIQAARWRRGEIKVGRRAVRPHR